MKKEHDEIAARQREEGYSKIWFKKALELLENNNINPRQVIDVGAGKGEFLELLEKKCNPRELWGIDYSQTNIDILKRKNIKVLEIDLENFELDKLKNDLKEKFDLIICLEVIEHVFDLDGLFKFFNQILKKNGYLIISTPNMASFPAKLFYLLRGYPLGDGHHIRFLTQKKLEHYAFFNGFYLKGYNNYFSFSSEIVKRGFGVRNNYVVNFLVLFFFFPFFILSKLGLADSMSNYGLVAMFKKNIDTVPCGLELENFINNFKNLNEYQKEAWKEKIRKFMKKNKLKEHIHFREYILNILNNE